MRFNFNQVLFDTGNTLISFPVFLKDQVTSAFRDYGIECQAYTESNRMFSQLGCIISDKSKIPSFIANIQGVKVEILGENLINMCQVTTTNLGKDVNTCLLNIEFMEGTSMMILGKAFLLNVYATFFLDRKQIWITSIHKQQEAALYAKKQAQIFKFGKIVDSKVWDDKKVYSLVLQALQTNTNVSATVGQSSSSQLFVYILGYSLLALIIA